MNLCSATGYEFVFDDKETSFLFHLSENITSNGSTGTVAGDNTIKTNCKITTLRGEDARNGRYQGKGLPDQGKLQELPQKQEKFQQTKKALLDWDAQNGGELVGDAQNDSARQNGETNARQNGGFNSENSLLEIVSIGFKDNADEGGGGHAGDSDNVDIKDNNNNNNSNTINSINCSPISPNYLELSVEKQ